MVWVKASTGDFSTKSYVDRASDSVVVAEENERRSDEFRDSRKDEDLVRDFGEFIRSVNSGWICFWVDRFSWTLVPGATVNSFRWRTLKLERGRGSGRIEDEVLLRKSVLKFTNHLE